MSDSESNVGNRKSARRKKHLPSQENEESDSSADESVKRPKLQPAVQHLELLHEDEDLELSTASEQLSDPDEAAELSNGSDQDEASQVSTSESTASEKYLESELSDPSMSPAPSLDAGPGIEPGNEAHVSPSNENSQDLPALRDLNERLEESEDPVCEQRRDPEGESEDSDDAQNDPEWVEAEVEEDDFMFPFGNDEEDQAEHQGLPGFDPPLYAGSPLTVGQSLIAILTYVIVHNVTGVGLADLLGLISLHCLATDNRCIKTLYLFKKYFKNMESPLKFHYFCSECFTPLESRSSVCQGENCPIDCPVSSFIEVSIIEQLANMFRRQGFADKLSHRFQRTKQNENNYEDIYDGKLYKEKMRSGLLDTPNNISFTWNSDGVSIYKSSKFSIWPLYLVVNELPYCLRYKKQNTIIAGLWYGTKKPSLPMFLNVFHEDLTQLYTGINFDVQGGTKVKVKGCILCGTCDTPAKSHFLNFTSHNGYYACPVCMIRGERSERTDNHHAFPYNNAPLRTTEETVHYASLAEQHNNSTIFGVKGPSALFLYIRDYVEATSIDVMHCLYEGVTKKLLHLWFDAEFYQEPYSLRTAADVVTSLIKDLTPPAFVTRLPRSISEHLAYWKASEFKTWLLYYSVPILSSIMTPEYLNHHLLLIHAAYLLNQESISEDMVVEAEVCLKEYVIKFSDLYHMKFISLNFHLLLHLPETVRNFGPLWTTSCMPFEDLNGQLKRLVHGTTHAELQITSSLSQVVNLPILISKLNPEDKIRKWSESILHKSKFAINERIANTMCTVGHYIKLTNVPPLIDEALLDAGVVGSVVQFFRLMKGKLLFYSKAYRRQMRTCSTAVRFKDGNQVKFGVIESFVRVSQCNCTVVCHCNAEFFSIINVLQTRNPFTIQYPKVTLPHIMKCEPQNIIAVPVKDLESVCFYFSVNNDVYILNPVNSIENE